MMVLVFTDIIQSVNLKTKHGDSAAAALIARHDAIFKRLIKNFVGAMTIKDTGDGFLAEFPTASDAVRFALRFQHAIATEDWGAIPLKVRIGVHLGEVSELDREERTGLSKLSGLAVDLTARVMGLAAPNQVLMTRAAFDGARQYIRYHPLADDDDGDKNLALKWMAHGSYIFQGSDDPMEVFEVGPVGVAPLEAPPDSEKARRSVAAEDEETLGWRPAAGLAVPMRAHWVLESKLGEGGFGEVWLGMHERTGERRVFKFCFDSEKLRSLKRELALFRLLRQVLGDRSDIAKLYEVQLDEPPFFLECEFTEDGSLVEWAKNQGGIEKVPLALRLDLIARIADAVAAAHSVGVLHKDIKPANILIYRAEDGSFRPRLTDFGIGELTDLARINGGTGPMAELQMTMLTESSSEAGTRMYAPPELLAGRMFTIQGDIYSLGVMLYQLVIGNLDQPLAQGWERDVDDPLLREDIGKCVEGHEQDRLASAKELAERLRTLPQRRKARTRKRVTKLAGLSSGILIVLLGISVVLMAHERQLRLRAERAEQTTDEVNKFMNNTLAEANFWEGVPKDAKLVDVVSKAAERLDEGHEFEERPEIEAELRATIGHIFRRRGMRKEAQPHLERALALRKALYSGDNADVADSTFEMAAWYLETRDFTQAEQLYKDALAMRQRLFGPKHVSIADSLNHLGACMDRMDRSKEAEQYYKQALDMRRELFGENHEDVAASYNNYATCLRGQGRFDDAEPLFRKSLESITNLRGENHPLVAIALHNLATDLIEQGKLDEAHDKLVRAVQIKRDTFPDELANMLAASIHKLAYVLAVRNKDELSEARELGTEALTIRKARYPAGHESILESTELLAAIELKLGNSADAETLIADAVNICKAHASDKDLRPVDESAELLIEQLVSIQRFDDAEAILLDAQRRAKNEPDARQDGLWRQGIALYERWPKPDRAKEFRDELAKRTS